MTRNEAETRADLIDPLLVKAGWGVVEGSRIQREYVISHGRIGNKDRKQLKCDYILVYKTQKLAVIEAKAQTLSVREGVMQAKDYAAKLDIRYSYATNGNEILAFDLSEGTEQSITAFPTPQELYAKTYATQNLWREKFNAIAYEDKGGTWKARFYQENAVKAVLESLIEGKKRILLTLATGTGKTSIAFHLAWKLFKARWTVSGTSRLPRILFLADRNVLANQAFSSFSPFPEDALIRINPKDVAKKKTVPKNGSIFFTIFQTFMSGEDNKPNFGEYPRDFFDFIIVDECHRGGANDESSWRDILDYFSPAVQLGLTATPKRKDNVDTYAYFGNPVYSYSLKDGINDGFLTPFKVKPISTTIDSYRYSAHDTIVAGEVDEHKIYQDKDFNQNIIIRQREEFLVQVLMKLINQKEKTIVFCKSQVHAALVRDLINAQAKDKDPFYCVRVTADDGAMGEQYLADFQDNEKTIPTILTTSQKLSTGVDARNVRNIVLLRPVTSMIEFKQIVGRGTRLFDGKDYFTIYDFYKANELFADPEWDGDMTIEDAINLDFENNDTVGEWDFGTKEVSETVPEGENPPPRSPPLIIKLADEKVRRFQFMETTLYLGADGKEITAAQFLQNLYGVLPEFFKNEDELRKLWGFPETRETLLMALSEKGFATEQLKDLQKAIEKQDCDLYDVLAYIAFASPPISRLQRVESFNKAYPMTYDEKQKEFIDFILNHYVSSGVDELASNKLSTLIQMKYGTPSDAQKTLGSIVSIKMLYSNFQPHLYQN
jgi:type I restriction enzyme, R subunit